MECSLQDSIDVSVLQDARVRYYALEALFNIAKVTREGFMPFFADTFEALFRLSADMDSAVHQATTYLDNLLKVGLIFMRSSHHDSPKKAPVKREVGLQPRNANTQRPCLRRYLLEKPQQEPDE